MIKIVNFAILCACCVPLCVNNVPDVCTYLIVAQTQKTMSQVSNAVRVTRLFLRQKFVSVIRFEFSAEMIKSSENPDFEKKNTSLLIKGISQKNINLANHPSHFATLLSKTPIFSKSAQNLLTISDWY